LAASNCLGDMSYPLWRIKPRAMLHGLAWVAMAIGGRMMDFSRLLQIYNRSTRTDWPSAARERAKRLPHFG